MNEAECRETPSQERKRADLRLDDPALPADFFPPSGDKSGVGEVSEDSE